MNDRIYLIGALALLAAGHAYAGSTANGVWTPSSCGPAPTPVSIDLSTSDAFSKSLDANDQYEEKSKTYQDCVFKEAAADGQAINTAQTTLQNLRSSTLAKNEADVKTGLDKYAKGKK